VEATSGFSFAYLKELFLSSMTQWMSNGGATSMDEVVESQVKLLRTQMSDNRNVAAEPSPGPSPQAKATGTWFGRAFTRLNLDR